MDPKPSVPGASRAPLDEVHPARNAELHGSSTKRSHGLTRVPALARQDRPPGLKQLRPAPLAWALGQTRRLPPFRITTMEMSCFEQRLVDHSRPQLNRW